MRGIVILSMHSESILIVHFFRTVSRLGIYMIRGGPTSRSDNSFECSLIALRLCRNGHRLAHGLGDPATLQELSPLRLNK